MSRPLYWRDMRSIAIDVKQSGTAPIRIPSGAAGGCRSKAVPASFTGRGKESAQPVSLWKNEGKNRSGRPVKGGLDAPDRLYDSEQKLTGFPPCLTVKI
jgi:hypothetical protein